MYKYRNANAKRRQDYYRGLATKETKQRSYNPEIGAKMKRTLLILLILVLTSAAWAVGYDRERITITVRPKSVKSLTVGWLRTNDKARDFNGDGNVNFIDFAIMLRK